MGVLLSPHPRCDVEGGVGSGSRPDLRTGVACSGCRAICRPGPQDCSRHLPVGRSGLPDLD